MLSVRSKTLKNWRERTVIYNFWSKELRIYKDKEQNPKKVKFFVNLNDFVVRWIDDKKFSLNSLSSTSVKLIVFSSKSQMFLTDWYENFRLSISNYKPLLERKIQLDLTRSSRVHSKSEFIMRKTKKNKRSEEEGGGGVQERDGGVKEGGNEREEGEAKEEGGRGRKEGEAGEIGERGGGGKQRDAGGGVWKENLAHSHSPFFSQLLLPSSAVEEAKRDEQLEGWTRESFECKSDYFRILSKKEPNRAKPETKEKRDNLNPTETFISPPLSAPFSNLLHKQAKLSDETGYELIIQKGRHKILRNYENKLKFKFFLHFPFFSPLIEDLLLNTPHFWNPALSQFQIKAKVSEEEVILLEKRKKMGRWYIPRFFVIKREIKRSQDITIIQMKSGKGKVEVEWPAIKGSLKRFLICLRRNSGVESEVEGFYSADNGGLVSEEQNSKMSLEYLKGFLELEQFIREKCIFEM